MVTVGVFYAQLLVWMGALDSEVVPLRGKDVWRSVPMVTGVQFVMMLGELLTPLSCAGNWDSLLLASV